jgi:hypothetical protein
LRLDVHLEIRVSTATHTHSSYIRSHDPP